MRHYSRTTLFLNQVFDIPYNVALQLKHTKNFIHYGLWKDLTEEQFGTLYELAQTGMYGDFFLVAEQMNTRRKHRRQNENNKKRMQEDPEYRERVNQRKKEKYRRNKNELAKRSKTNIQ